MLSIFKKLFGKTETKAAVVPAAPAAVPRPANTPLPTIEVAHLSLAAIVARFPDELKPLIVGAADPASTVALPLPTILKQLPLGSVKMSLASLHRQAHGLIKPLPPSDKRTVDVPLAEIFRHVRPSSLKRRPDQRPYYVPDSGFNLFGDSANPYAIAPDDTMPEPIVLDLTEVAPPPTPLPARPTPAAEETPVPEAPATPQPQRVLQMDASLRQQFSNGAPAPAAASPEAAPRPTAPLAAPSGLNLVKPAGAPAAPAAKISKPTGPTLPLVLVTLIENWPEDIRTEIAALDPATKVVLPVTDVTAGLTKGRVTFTWNQIHSWLEPEPTAPSAAAADTVLQLPLKVVAPAFLATSSKKPAADRKSLSADESIPALFSSGKPAAEATPVAAPVEPAAEPAAEPAPEPVPAEAAPAPAPHKLPETVGEIFGQPHKKDWTPAEIVAQSVNLPGVAGAIVALQEGLQVSSSLPEGVKSEVVAAFLPQIFARLNQYSGEMRLGDVDDLLFTTHGAHCQIYRLGYIYFAVLGKAGESLPWHELRLITEELARQTTHK